MPSEGETEKEDSLCSAGGRKPRNFQAILGGERGKIRVGFKASKKAFVSETRGCGGMFVTV